MATARDPGELGADQVVAAATVLARAFQDDAGTVFFLPDAAERAAILPAFFAPMVRFAVTHGETATLGDPLAAVAFWLPPEVAATPAGLEEAGMGAVVASWSPTVQARFGAFVGHLGAEHARLMGEIPHWTLFFVGVVPGSQGAGLGSRLLRPMRERLQQDGAVCYTETLEARNLPFYERLGFRVIAESDVPGSRTHVWSLRVG